MPFTSIVELSRVKGTKVPKSQTKLVMSGHNRKDGSKNIVFFIGKYVMEQAGIIKGDRVDVLYDAATNEGILRRDNNGGRTVSFNKQGRGVVSFKWVEGMPVLPTGPTPMSGLDYKDNEILFDFPQGNGDPHGV